ncbi:isoprenylcysteine carboxylmethyltransferase family protein [Sinomicrobium kalidii]|uniref:methyltransferase family protein n=1 Tax=Sinomicrobium kalidii TaxID=2900738 RepID=UPI001E5C3605|nr:isoprenylcysteine carboxylmethyltransferase family protein [Sinomicrobium kalidii]UGU15462.1 isoprenylcysteine carboxylmethyltransferase family protein [Sinomicrobium kalidii]
MALREELLRQGNFLFEKRSYLPLSFLIIGICVKIYQITVRDDVGILLNSEILKSSSLAIGLFGFLIRIFTVGYTPKNTSGRNTGQGQVADKLNTTGLYSLTRNPLYLGNYFMWMAIAMATGSPVFVIVFTFIFWIYYERIIFAEEEFLRMKFGKEYIIWSQQTPVFLPKNFKYISPEISFSWKKVLKKEKNGLFALFLILFLFDTIENSLKNGSLMFEMGLSTIGTIFAGSLYLLLKYLKKRTSVLNEKGR